jgi:periplasmic divalent cation tolerance protein
MIESKFCIIFTNTDDQDLAYKIAKALIEEKLAACASVYEVKSFFIWGSAVNERQEFRIMIKSKSENYQKIKARVLELHNDEVPEIIQIDITNGLESYLNWISET